MIETTQLSYIIVLVTLGLTFLAVLFPFELTGGILRYLRKKVKEHVEKNLIRISDDLKYLSSEIDKNKLKKLEELELKTLDDNENGRAVKILEEVKKVMEETFQKIFSMEKRASGLNWLTKTISIIEFSMFVILTSFLFLTGSYLLSVVKIVGAFMGGWMTIKLLIQHDAWNDRFVGKAYYYISLLGTLLNIAAAISLVIVVKSILF